MQLLTYYSFNYFSSLSSRASSHMTLSSALPSSLRMATHHCLFGLASFEPGSESHSNSDPGSLAWLAGCGGTESRDTAADMERLSPQTEAMRGGGLDDIAMYINTDLIISIAVINE